MIDEELDKLRAHAARAARNARARSIRSKRTSIGSMERVGGFGGKANQLNAYYTGRRHAGLLPEGSRSLSRALTPADIKAAVEKYLPKDRRVELSVVPEKEIMISGSRISIRRSSRLSLRDCGRAVRAPFDAQAARSQQAARHRARRRR